MEWSEDGVVLGCRRHGEANVLLDLFTRGHGRHLGLVRGGRSQKHRSALQPGNGVSATWRARLDEHLGNYTLEPSRMRAAALIDDPRKLAGLASLVAMAQLVPERQPFERLYDAFVIVLDALGEGDHWPALMVRWELGLLDELGFGLDLSQCAATGTRDDLVYVSPKSGRAVSAGAGEPYAPKLLALPTFLTGRSGLSATRAEIVSGFEMTGFFLQRHVFDARGGGMPTARERLVQLLRKQADSV